MGTNNNRRGGGVLSSLWDTVVFPTHFADRKTDAPRSHSFNLTYKSLKTGTLEEAE